MRPPLLLLNIGEPKPGFAPLADLIQKRGVAVRSYCNGDAHGHDLVTDVPLTLPPFQPYRHIVPLTGVSQSPPDDDPWAFFRYHHAQLYRAAVLKLDPQPTTNGIADSEIVNLAAAIYAYPGDPAIAWDHYDAGDGDGVCWALKRSDALDVVALRGSTTQEDWIRDFIALATPWTAPQLGPVHPGFFLGMEQVWREVQGLLRPSIAWAVTGHSLGAGRAAILTGLACV